MQNDNKLLIPEERSDEFNNALSNINNFNNKYKSFIPNKSEVIDSFDQEWISIDSSCM